MPKPIFKTYQQNQVYLFPPSLEDMIDLNHPVRVVSEVIDHIDMDIIIKKYKGGGTTSYHPRMLLKVLIYSYLDNVEQPSDRSIGKGKSISSGSIKHHVTIPKPAH